MEPHRLAIALNAATNGRLFCVLFFLIWLVVYFKSNEPGALVMTTIAAIPVGLACLSDNGLIREKHAASFMFALSSIFLAALHALATLVIVLFFW